MNESSESPTSRHLSAPWASAAGVTAVGLLTGLVWLTGLLPVDTPAFVATGALLACIAGALGCGFHIRAARLPGGSPEAAQKFQIALVLDFLVKLMALVVGLGVLWLTGVKFPGLAGFGLSFAGMSMAFQLVSSISLARAWSRRNRASPPKAGGSSSTDPLRRIPTAD